MIEHIKNPRALVGVIAQTDPVGIETAYGIDGRYVYRRETNLAEAVPCPHYFRAEHREVLADDKAWDEGRAWETCRVDGQPLHPTWNVRVTFEKNMEVSAVDEDGARVKAMSRLGLSEAVLKSVKADATLNTGTDPQAMTISNWKGNR